MNTTGIADTIEREMVLRAPVERVWAALTDPAELIKWFGDGAEIDLRPGGSAVFHFGDERCPAIVATVEPLRRFAYYWMPGPSDGAQELGPDGRTLVDFTLEPVDGGTRLRMVESGFAALANPSAQADNIEGWNEELAELAAHLHAA
jgi:uncharacterized protein YndB with AHSA1/START domain